MSCNGTMLPSDWQSKLLKVRVSVEEVLVVSVAVEEVVVIVEEVIVIDGIFNLAATSAQAETLGVMASAARLGICSRSRSVIRIRPGKFLRASWHFCKSQQLCRKDRTAKCSAGGRVDRSRRRWKPQQAPCCHKKPPLLKGPKYGHRGADGSLLLNRLQSSCFRF